MPLLTSLSTINGTIFAVTEAAVVTIVRESELRVDGNIYVKCSACIL